MMMMIMIMKIINSVRLHQKHFDIENKNKSPFMKFKYTNTNADIDYINLINTSTFPFRRRIKVLACRIANICCKFSVGR